MAYDNLVLEPLSVVQKLRQVGLYADFAPGSLTPGRRRRPLPSPAFDQ